MYDNDNPIITVCVDVIFNFFGGVCISVNININNTRIFISTENTNKNKYTTLKSIRLFITSFF
jgi:hypothetical protein